MNLFIAPFVNALFGLYYLVGDFGLSVILVTIIIRLVLLPLIWPSLKSAKKIKEIQPRLNKLKEKYGSDKQALAKAQMDLYKQEGINPLSGCLPQILQIVVLLLFFSAFNMVTGFSGGKGSVDQINNQLIPSFRIDENFKFDLNFLGSDLATTPSGVFKQGINLNLVLPLFLLFGSGLLQFFSAKLMMPNTKIDEKIVEKTKDKEDDMMAAMRTQSLYMMPAMTIFIGWNFSLGLLLYWFTTSALMIGQQVLVNKVNKK
ncbi:MAG: YidC/Oxa1 family membrane protein insertase [Candidatus Shapirobacteria bacterium]|nr:YidC/Oxa1 family membrane protein insertase [Candidatus Shapirobacteria bacterium]